MIQNERERAYEVGNIENIIKERNMMANSLEHIVYSKQLYKYLINIHIPH